MIREEIKKQLKEMSKVNKKLDDQLLEKHPILTEDIIEEEKKLCLSLKNAK